MPTRVSWVQIPSFAPEFCEPSSDEQGLISPASPERYRGSLPFFARLAQLVERRFYTANVGSSSLSLCTKVNMKQITEKEYELFQKLKKVWEHSQAELTGAYFICGEGGDKDILGLPAIILVCPTMGADGFCVYTRGEYTAPSY